MSFVAECGTVAEVEATVKIIVDEVNVCVKAIVAVDANIEVEAKVHAEIVATIVAAITVCAPITSNCLT
jgi:hypothetical protein